MDYAAVIHYMVNEQWIMLLSYTLLLAQAYSNWLSNSSELCAPFTPHAPTALQGGDGRVVENAALKARHSNPTGVQSAQNHQQAFNPN